jgi:hypothetical protein
LGRERVIERERRWARPAAIAAFLALALYLGSFVIEQTADLYTGDSEAAQLRSLHDKAGTIVLASIVRAAGFLSLPFAILYLFRAAQARNPRVHGAMLGFVFIGPVLFAGQGVLQAAGASQAASDFVEQAPSEGSRSVAEFRSELKRNPRRIEEVTVYTEANQLEVQRTDDIFYSVDYPDKAERGLDRSLAQAHVDQETDADSGATAGTSERPGGDALATHLTDNAGTLQVARALLFPAVLGLVVMMVYVPLQALRAGLLTRFLGSLGMALGASMILILPVALLATVAWTAYLGFLFLGRVPGGRPPAWEAGVAIPWPRQGEEEARPPRPSGEAVEGKATEVGEGSGGGPAPRAGQPRSRRQKRKRRR